VQAAALFPVAGLLLGRGLLLRRLLLATAAAKQVADDAADVLLRLGRGTWLRR
jgi:hypothetical protein